MSCECEPALRARLPAWRFSLEDISTGMRSGFADLDALIKHLMDLMEQLPEQMPDTQARSTRSERVQLCPLTTTPAAEYPVCRP